MECESRVVVLIDMDCFYCQVEEKLNPELKGKPIAVVQYNPWKGGGIIAVNYVARAMGVTRHMRGDEAKEKCPEIELPSVPCTRGKADITKYRDAGKDVARVLQKFTPLLERASIDEAYLDITAPVQERLKTLNVNSITVDQIPNTYALGYDTVEGFLCDVHSCGSDAIEFDYEHAQRLLVGAVIVSEIRAAVYEETGYRCSAGIAHNKILAKLVCGMNKPNKQTILPTHSINILYNTLPLKKVKHLGGKFGYTVCEVLKITKMGELQGFSEKELQNKFDEKNGTWLYNIARGIDLEPVQARFNPKSIGCCKNFRGKAALLNLESLRKWLKELGDEIEDRLEKDALENNRTPKQLVVSYSSQLPDGRDVSSSRSYNFVGDDELCGDFFSSKALELLMESSEGIKVKDCEPNRRLKGPIKFLGISVGKFEDNDVKKVKSITDYFSAGASKPIPDRKSSDKNKDGDKKSNLKDPGKEYILQKFFQVTDKNKDKPSEIKGNPEVTEPNPVTIESTLDKQESFFAKMLNKKMEFDTRSVESEASLQSMTKKLEEAKPTTPVCEVVNCGDNSNDSDYSGSTINNEINKSIALFEEEPNETERINNMRQLLNKSTKDHNLEKSEPDKDSEEQGNVEVSEEKTKLKTHSCPECKKIIPIDMVEQHSDYHFALKLREEERQQVRQERSRKVPTNNTPLQSTKKEDKKKKVEEPSTIDKTKSITNFLVKICDKTITETCTECGKKIPVDKISEHKDFHEAQKLNRELNHHRHNLVQSSSSVKRKRTSSSPSKKQKIAKCKSIDSFFKVA